MKKILYSVSLIAIFFLTSCEPEPSEEEVSNNNQTEEVQEDPGQDEQSEYASTEETNPEPVEKVPEQIFINTPPPVEKVQSCDQAAQAVFLSVKDVQDYLSEPDVTYVFEYKPDDEGNPNGRYWFWIFSARQGFNATETYARYQVDPQTLEVYEFDMVEDKAIPVKSDNKLRKEVRRFCAK